MKMYFIYLFIFISVLFQQGRSHSRPVVLLFQRALLQYKNTYFDIQQNKILHSGQHKNHILSIQIKAYKINNKVKIVE